MAKNNYAPKGSVFDYDIPEISQDDDNISTIRISTIDNKRKALWEKQPDGGASFPSSSVRSSSVGVKQVRPEIISKHQNQGEIIEPVLVVEKQDGYEEVVHAKPLYNYREHHPPVESKRAQQESARTQSESKRARSESSRPQSSGSLRPIEEKHEERAKASEPVLSPPAAPPPPPPAAAPVSSPPAPHTVTIASPTTDSSDTDIHPPPLNLVTPATLGHDEADKPQVSKASILKKSEDNDGRKRSVLNKKIKWNENVQITEQDSKEIQIGELQQEDHEFNPLDEPKTEVYQTHLPNGTNGIENNHQTDTSDYSSIGPANGRVPHDYDDIRERRERDSRRAGHLPPYGSDYYERGHRRRDMESKWCMRITVIVLMFLLTFAAIGLIVLGLMYAWR